MLIEILKRTPTWVFVLFFVLLTLGYFQSKARTLGRGKVSILPCVIITLSFYGVLSAFGTAPVGLISWFVGAASAVWLGLALAAPKGVVYCDEIRSFSIPGSWVPLLLMMAIFFTKYAVGVVLARQLPCALEAKFIGAISLSYGCLGGLFLARTLVIWRSAKQNAQNHV